MNANTTSTDANWKQLLSGKNGLLALALTGGVTLQAINIYLSTTILPTVVEDIGGLSLYAWNTTLFITASIIGAVLSSPLLDKGVHTAYIWAAVLLFFGCLISAMASNMPVMLIGRFLQGAGGGIFLALGYAMVTIVYEESLWPRALALISGMWGIATLFGPAIGGFFAEFGIWRAAFATMLPVLLVYTIFVIKTLPKSAIRQSEGGLPYSQLVFLTISVLGISIASTETGVSQIGWFLLAFIFFGLLIKVEKQATYRLFPREVLEPSSALFAIFLTIFLLLLSVSSEIFIPYFLQSLHSLSPLFAGYVASMMAIGWGVSEIYCARFTGKNVANLIKAGPILVLLGLVTLLAVVPKASDSGFISSIIISTSLLAIGVGIGAVWPHLTTLTFISTPEEEQSLAASSMTTVMMFASALGSAIAGMIANARGFNIANDPLIVSDTAFWLFSIFCFISVFAIFSSRKIVSRAKERIINT